MDRIPVPRGISASDGATSSGLKTLGSVPWGSHLCHFYQSGSELERVLVPYFRAGLERNERCIWVTAPPFEVDQARLALGAEVPDLAAREADRQIDILDYSSWYERSGELPGPRMVETWLEEARRACECGRSGLRIAGNASWVDRERWLTMAAYEAELQQSFRDRRILALCSYSLDACTADDTIDVLRNHGRALLVDGDHFDVIHGATELLAAVGNRTPRQYRHVVRFFRSDSYPAAEIAEFFAGGLESGAPAIAVASQEHVVAIRAALCDRGVAPDSLRVLDLDGLLAEGDANGLAAVVRRITAQLDPERPTFIYGELVDVLCKRGDVAGALQLETLYSEATAGFPVAAICGYDLSSFQGEAGAWLYHQICRVHEGVSPSTAKAEQDLLADALFNELGKTRGLTAERARLLRAERHARARAEAMSNTLARLQRVTAALSETVSLASFAVALEEIVLPALGVARGFVVCPEPDYSLRVVASIGIEPAVIELFIESPCDAHLPSADAFREGRPVWLHKCADIQQRYPGLPTPAQAIACVPLTITGHRRGVMALGFSGPQRFDASQRALIEDVAHQVALTLERLRLSEEATAERARAEDASRAKDAFLAMLGHELRNPLSPILSALELMRLQNGSVFMRERQVMERQVSHLARLVDDLLDVSRITRGKIDLDRGSADVEAIIRDAVDGVSPFLERRGHRLELDLTPGVELWADAARLRQVFANLLDNAAKYTPPGGRIQVVSWQSHGWVIVEVRDDGTGIPLDVLPALFDPFVQSKQSPDRSAGGLGLGLAIVRSLVELHGGDVSGESEGLGRGSVFRVRLPSGTDRSQAARPPSLRPSPKREAGRRILLVDDNSDGAETMAALLRTWGHEVVVAVDGPSALSSIVDFTPEIALLDLGQPLMDGFQLASELRARLGDARPHLVAVTGYGAAADRDRTRAEGFAAHLVKPVDSEELRSLVAAL